MNRRNKLESTSSASKYASHGQRMITKVVDTSTVPLTGPAVSGCTLQSERMLRSVNNGPGHERKTQLANFPTLAQYSQSGSSRLELVFWGLSTP